MRLPALLAMAWLMLPTLAIGQRAEVPTELWLAKSSGTWRDADRYGFYRVAVYRAGREHARDSIEVHIIEIVDDGVERRIVKSIPIDALGHGGNVKDISFTRINDQLMAISLDIQVRGMEGIVLREVFSITPAGTIKVVTEAEYRDIHN